MAKKSRSSPPLSYKPPTPEQERRYAAEHAARVAVDTDPEIKAMRKKKENAIVDEILGVMTRRLE